MKSYSFFTIILLCIAILIVDILAFYWLQSITQLIISNFFRISIYVLFWTFTLGLITSILVLKIRLDAIDPKRKQLLISSFYGLTISSFFPKLIFVIIITILYYSNYLFSETASIILVPFVGLLSGFLPFFIILYGVFKSLYHFKIHSHTLHFTNLPKSFNGLRIVQISDIHIGSFNNKHAILNRAIEKINFLKADCIFITGDLVNNYAWELDGWTPIFKKLKAKKGKYAILGNHDYGDYSQWKSMDEKKENFEAIQQFYKNINFKLLMNEAATITNKNKEQIAVIGVENWGKPPFEQYGDLQKALKQVQKVPFKILLSHDPSHWAEEVVNKTDISLTLSGHTHGMQAAFQYKNFQWSPIKLKYKHWAGLYQEETQYLYVNRGLGWLGFPGRLGMRPEITLIEICN
ncbi:metallophosphoesterase [uncultured Polaribacter sp.]|uniref:metallophosphoesterase n=1 Tax=uncultured Polaribacter sp. TaxID=174711 RepID=UPI00261E7E78|nr:metallophosphoesterase [uncultured Polaribacter sp.]